MTQTQAARLHFEHGHFSIILPGDHVICAATGVRIPLDQLKYWSVDLQEPYASAEASYERWRQVEEAAGRPARKPARQDAGTA